MNKMTKGALATGLGVALLLGGGGTLAVWNQTAEANAGTIVAGDLGITAATTGEWGTNGSPIEDWANYKIVPNETVTYTQNANVTLSGEQLRAKLTVTGLPTGDLANDLEIVSVTAAFKNGSQVLTPSTTVPGQYESAVLDQSANGSATLTATVRFRNVDGRTGTTEKATLNNIKIKLEQVAPTAPAN